MSKNSKMIIEWLRMTDLEDLILHIIEVKTGEKIDKLPEVILNKALDLKAEISSYNAERGFLDTGYKPEDLISL